MRTKKSVWLSVIGGLLFATGIFMFVLPELGKSGTVGLLLAFIGWGVVTKATLACR